MNVPLRDLTAQCGEPTALSRLSNSIAGGNSSILAEAQLYKHTSHGSSLSELHHQHAAPPPNASQLIEEFHKQQQNIPQFIQPILIDPLSQMSREFDSISLQDKQHERTLVPQLHAAPPSNMLQAHDQFYRSVLMGPQYMTPQLNMPVMSQPPIYRPPLMIMTQPQQQPQPIAISLQQSQKQQISEHKITNEIITNSTQDTKSEKEVADELTNLRPRLDDLPYLSNVLNIKDNKMQNSKFFELLRDLQTRPLDMSTISNDNNVEKKEIPMRNINYDQQPNMDQFSQMEAPWQQASSDVQQQWENLFTDSELKDISDINNSNWLSLQNPQELYSKTIEYKFVNTENKYLDKINDVSQQDMFFVGKQLMKHGKLSDAICAFEAAIKINKNRSEAWRLLGFCHADNENDKLAIAALQKCVELDAYDLEALLQLGVSCHNELSTLSSLNYLTMWLSNHADYSHIVAMFPPASNEDKIINGGIVSQESEHNRVMNMFEIACKENPDDADIHVVLGVLYNINGKFKEAEKHFKFSVCIRPNDPTLWNKLGATQANGKNPQDAIKSYSKALGLKPNYVRVLSNLGISFQNQRMYREACQSYLAALNRNEKAGDGEVWNNLSMCLIFMNRGDLADLSYKRDVQLFRPHFDF